MSPDDSLMHRAVPSRSHSLRALALWMAALGCWGCASYPQRTAAALEDFQRGHLSAAQTEYEDRDTTGSEFLRGAEAGTVALARGDWDGALTNLGAAAEVSREAEDAALISAERSGEWLLSWILNESVLKYEGEGYERVLLHAGMALAYLGKNNLSDAEVELRRANALLEREEELYKKEYAAGGLGHFLSAVTYELDGKPDEAYIDYKRMQAKGLGGELVGRALVRLAARLDYSEDLREWKQKFGFEPEKNVKQASIVVVAAVGLGPYKRETSLSIPTPNGLFKWAIPTYVDRLQTIQGVSLGLVGGDTQIATVVIEDSARVARENLDDRIAWLAAKSAVRGLMKHELTRQLSRNLGGHDWDSGGAALGWIIGAVATAATERADLRCWQTLPHTWQAAHAFVDPGTSELFVQAGSQRVDLGRYQLAAGETMFLFVRTLDGHVFAHAIGGQKLENQVAEPKP